MPARSRGKRSSRARYVLGASRGRIVGQLFIEMLVLAAVGAGIALMLARLVLQRLEQTVHRELVDGAPFWMDFTLSYTTVLFAALLAVVAALIAGVVPALKATGRQMQTGLRALGGRLGMRLGLTWAALVVIQVALSVAALPSAVEMGWGTVRNGILGPGFDAEKYLTARLAMDPEAVSGGGSVASRFHRVQAELVRQLDSEPGVSRITLAARVPGEEPWANVEVEGAPRVEAGLFASDNLIRYNRVDHAFFDVFDVPLLTGRGFAAGDFEPARAAVIVNQTFARQLFGQENPLGRRVRLAARRAEDAAAWAEIVGVVADRPANATHGTMYQPVARGEMHPVSLALRTEAAPAGLMPRLRELALTLDPALRIDEIVPLDQIYREQEVGNNVGASVLVAITLSVLLLSAAGIYALMSFTVNQRRREIGIRSALGARPWRLLADVFRRALGQLAIGAFGGVLVALLIDFYLPIEKAGGWEVPGVIPAATLLMMIVGLLATAGPARRGFEVEPTEAMRDS